MFFYTKIILITLSNRKKDKKLCNIICDISDGRRKYAQFNYTLLIKSKSELICRRVKN